MRPETSKQIETAAADWAARVDSGCLSSSEDELLEQWLSGDSRRRGAFMRLRAVALHSQRAKALGSTFDPSRFDRNFRGAAGSLTSAISRPRFWMGGSALAACLAGLFAVLSFFPNVTHETALGQVRVVTLEDGSVVTLNTDTAIRVRFTDGSRRIILDRGEALFEVAKNKARPFVVEANGTSVTAIGTSFTVERLGEAPVEIIVREGIVEVRRISARQPVRMVSNTKLISSDTPNSLVPVRMPSADIVRELAWKSGQIAFEGETLANAARAFERYSDTRIIIEDPSLEREEITGLFTSNDPVSFARASALSLDLEVKVGPNEVRLSKR